MARRNNIFKIAAGLIIILLAAVLIVQNLTPLKKFFAKRRKEFIKVVKSFPFSAENSLKEWEEKVLKNKVFYRIEQEAGREGQKESYVRATSEKAASALYYKIKLNIAEYPTITWKWRVIEFPKRKLPESLSSTKEEDFAARVYVIFPAMFFTNSKVVEYVWAGELPVGTAGASGYSGNIKIMVLESGPRQSDDPWAFEERDIVKDYELLFGEKPRLNIGAIAFMTDADSTKTSADSVYDEITIGYRGEEEN